MTLGGAFLLLTCVLEILLGSGLLSAPRIEHLAQASLALGLLLHGVPVAFWPRP
jgi:hypothetical protein